MKWTILIRRKNGWIFIFSGRDPGFFPQIHLVGSDFHNRAGEIMYEIPYGKTVTYGWIADQIANERGLERLSAQAVGSAVGHNPICIIITWHRVVGASQDTEEEFCERKPFWNWKVMI